MQLSLQELCDRLGLSLSGLDPQTPISGVNSLDEAGPGDLSFLANPRYLEQLPVTRAAAVLIRPELAGRCSRALPSADPRLDFGKAMQLFSPLRRAKGGISSQAHVDPTAELGADCVVSPFVYVGPGTKVGQGCALYPGVYVGADCVLGQNCVLYPNSVLMDGCRLGDQCVLQPGAVIGAEGFGFARTNFGIQKIPQIGNVELGNRVEIGANSAVDRAALSTTRIGDGSCLDNLVQIGHNCRIGRDCIVVAQSGISGSSSLGDGVTVAAQAGVAGHLSVGDRATIGPKTGVARDIEPDKTVAGFLPALDKGLALKNAVLFPKLPELFKRVTALEKACRTLASTEDQDE